jgi:hypothetical protein
MYKACTYFVVEKVVHIYYFREKCCVHNYVVEEKVMCIMPCKRKFYVLYLSLKNIEIIVRKHYVLCTNCESILRKH